MTNIKKVVLKARDSMNFAMIISAFFPNILTLPKPGISNPLE